MREKTKDKDAEKEKSKEFEAFEKLTETILKAKKPEGRKKIASKKV